MNSPISTTLKSPNTSFFSSSSAFKLKRIKMNHIYAVSAIENNISWMIRFKIFSIFGKKLYKINFHNNLYNFWVELLTYSKVIKKIHHNCWWFISNYYPRLSNGLCYSIEPCCSFWTIICLFVRKKCKQIEKKTFTDGIQKNAVKKLKKKKATGLCVNCMA